MRHIRTTKTKGLAMALTLLLSLCASAQQMRQGDTREVMHSTMIGIGHVNTLDTYLSPYNYTGTDFRCTRETMRMTSLMGGAIAYQTHLSINGAGTENRTLNVKEYTAGIHYSNAWLYDLGDATTGITPLRIFAGAAATAYVGGIYNNRNGNNPANGHISLMAEAEAIATYDLRLWNRDHRIRYQLNIPLIGCAFAPEYGESYYEIFNNHHYADNIRFAYPGNTPSLRHQLTVDIPVSHSLVRIGYTGEFLQSQFSHLKFHSYTHDFMIGWVKYFDRK